MASNQSRTGGIAVLITAAAAAVIAVATAVALKGKRQARTEGGGGASGRGGGGAASVADDVASSVAPLSARSTRSAVGGGGGGPVAAAAAAAAMAASKAAAGSPGGKAAAGADAAGAASAQPPAPQRSNGGSGNNKAAPKPPPPALTDAQVDAALRGNARLLTPQQLATARLLLEEDQAHLFAAWGSPPPPDASAAAAAAAAADADKKRALLDQAARLDAAYAHGGGLRGYLRNARRLLAESREGSNPFDGYEPSVPEEGERLDYGSDRFLSLERQGAAAARDAAFVLVAGGLGERLGYSGLKVALPTQSVTGACFLELYVRWILALEKVSGSARPLPLAIMTSDDTHARTEALLASRADFGAAPGQITLLKQDKVASLSDSAAHLALDPTDPWAILTKPHGHGDVHALLHSSGLARKWRDDLGVKWVAFFQDTNALVFRALVPALGLSAERGLDVNSVAVPRRAKEAIGAIATLTWRGRKGGSKGGGGGKGAAAAAAGASSGGGAAPASATAGAAAAATWAAAAAAQQNGSQDGGSQADDDDAAAAAGSPRARSKTRRGRRGGRRHNKKSSLAVATSAADGEPAAAADASAADGGQAGAAATTTEEQQEQQHQPPRRPQQQQPQQQPQRRRLKMTCNVEYNLLDPLLRATISPDQGDADDPATGLSPFPGNINQLVLRLDSYCAALERTGGVIAEFVNPKYADPAARAAFKSPTRLECMMQDYPRTLPESASVGFTVVNQVWAAYSPVKNGREAAAGKAGAGEPTHSAAAAEFDQYKSACRALAVACGCEVAEGGVDAAAAYGGVTVEDGWPRVVLSPEFAPTLDELRRKVVGGGGGGAGGGGDGKTPPPPPPPIKLSARSVLVLDGAGIEVRGPLEVDGALVIRAAPGARVVVGAMAVRNGGWEWRPLREGEGAREEDAMRGFVVERRATAEYVFDAPGEYVLPLPAAAAADVVVEEEAVVGGVLAAA